MKHIVRDNNLRLERQNFEREGILVYNLIASEVTSFYHFRFMSNFAVIIKFQDIYNNIYKQEIWYLFGK